MLTRYKEMVQYDSFNILGYTETFLESSTVFRVTNTNQVVQLQSQGATQDDFSGQFFRIFEIIIICFAVAICDLVQDVKTIFHLSYVLTASKKSFLKYE